MVATTFDPDWSIPIGTKVYTADGAYLGSVIDGDAYELVVQRGFLRVHDYEIPLAAFDRLEDGRLILKLSMNQVIARHEAG
jgi:hypothetical protein